MPRKQLTRRQYKRKKLQRHLDHLRTTGQMSKWLEHRLEVDEALRDRIFAEMFPPKKSSMQEIMELQMRAVRKSIEEQVQKHSIFMKYYEGR